MTLQHSHPEILRDAMLTLSNAGRALGQFSGETDKGTPPSGFDLESTAVQIRTLRRVAENVLDHLGV